FPATGMSVRLPSRAVLMAMLLGVALQWTIARVYGGLIVESFGGASAAQSGGGLWIPISYLLTAISCAACTLYCERRPAASRVMVVIQLVAVVLPLQALVVARFEFARPLFAAGITLAYLGTLALVALTPEVRVPRASVRVSLLLLVGALLVTAYVLWALLTRGGLGRISFDLTAVYEVREEFLTRIGPFMGYLVPWQGYVLNPTLLLLALRRRSLLSGLAGLALQLLLFGMTGFRAFLVLPALLLAFYVIARRRQLVAVVLSGMLAVIAIALLLYAWLDQPLIPLLLVDRVIVVPAEIHYWYYDFFGVHRHALLQLSQSVLAPLAVVHYRVPIAEVIGWTYMGSAASANVGLFGDAYANFGFAGCAVFALLFALVLKAVDAAGRATDARIAAALVAVPAFELVNAGLLTTLLTHGLALTILVLWALAPVAPQPMPAVTDPA
ncbi:MAG TPA: hypothetical protein VL176_13655, partial [Steroidobacteraceae bacterium]|nr:hypothetical protein [Steroidobacteraceae bacterium]